ncbi:IgaA/UmoB family intracellular growth attenuator [Shigella flexneri]
MAMRCSTPSFTQASIRGEESEQIELLNIRPETHEEYALSRLRDCARRC